LPSLPLHSLAVVADPDPHRLSLQQSLPFIHVSLRELVSKILKLPSIVHHLQPETSVRKIDDSLVGPTTSFVNGALFRSSPLLTTSEFQTTSDERVTFGHIVETSDARMGKIIEIFYKENNNAYELSFFICLSLLSPCCLVPSFLPSFFFFFFFFFFHLLLMLELVRFSRLWCCLREIITESNNDITLTPSSFDIPVSSVLRLSTLHPNKFTDTQNQLLPLSSAPPEIFERLFGVGPVPFLSNENNLPVIKLGLLPYGDGLKAFSRFPYLL
jgi:hypothetical protein